MHFKNATVAAFSVAVLMVTAASAPAPAQQGSAGEISAEQAIEIARRQGLVEVKEIERDNGKWEVEGRDSAGREIEVDIDRRTGNVLKVERD